MPRVHLQADGASAHTLTPQPLAHTTQEIPSGKTEPRRGRARMASIWVSNPADEAVIIAFFSLQIHPRLPLFPAQNSLRGAAPAAGGQPGAPPPAGSLAAVAARWTSTTSSFFFFFLGLTVLCLSTSWPRTRPPWRPQRLPCSAATAAASAGCCWRPAARRPRRGASARSGSPRCRTGCRPCTWRCRCCGWAAWSRARRRPARAARARPAAPRRRRRRRPPTSPCLVWPLSIWLVGVFPVESGPKLGCAALPSAFAALESGEEEGEESAVRVCLLCSCELGSQRSGREAYLSLRDEKHDKRAWRGAYKKAVRENRGWFSNQPATGARPTVQPAYHCVPGAYLLRACLVHKIF